MSNVIQLCEQFIVNRPLHDVYPYLLDFSNIAQWDASVISCQKISHGAITQGTIFDLILKSAGRKVPMAYTLTTHQKQHLVFTGILAHLVPLMKSSLIKLGKTSIQGLQQALANNSPTPTQRTHLLRSKLILPELWHFTKYGYLQAQKNWQPVSNNMHNKHIVITGASSGLGLASALALAQKGCRLTLVVRNQSKGEAVKQQIMEQTGNRNILLEIADMSLMSDVIKLSQRLQQQQPIDVLINNAGALFNPRQQSSEGLEQSFALLLLSPFILTQQLKPLFAPNARVINVLSGGMYSQAIDGDDLESKHGTYWGSAAYAKEVTQETPLQRAQLWQSLLAYEEKFLAKSIKGIS